MVDPLFPDEEEKTPGQKTEGEESVDQGVSPLFPAETARRPPAPAPVIAVTALDMPAGAEPRARSPVSPLTFSEKTAPQRATGPAEASVAFDERDAPAVVAAMRGAAEKFPQLCADREHALRSRFQQILPFTFDVIAQYGRADLDRNATLLGRVTAESQEWSTLALAEATQAIIEAAKPAHGLFGKMLRPSADGAELHRRIAGLAQASDALGKRIDALVDEQVGVAAAFKVHLAVLAVCVSMQSAFAEVIQRRAAMFALAEQECGLAAAQLETLRKGVREGILRLDEVRNVTMPAMGFLQGA